MRSSSEPSAQEVLGGLVERVTFHNAENGFCVLRAKARGHRDLVTVVGHAATISAGEWITASGEWINDRTHGQQFKARFLKTSAPSSIDGIEKYLGSGMIRGIGPAYAKKLVRAFGEKVCASCAETWAPGERRQPHCARSRHYARGSDPVSQDCQAIW
jgi:exodeoxyribonuclease V alpha subunit